MPNKDKNIPKRRFKEFENADAWELRKLKELADFSKGLGYTKSDLTESGNPIILYGRLYTKYQTVIDNVDTFVDVKDKSVVSIGGEVIVPSSGESSEDIARASVVDNAGVILGGDLNVIKPKDEIDSTFLALTISNGQKQKELSKRAQGKSVVHLHNSDLKEVNLIFPSIDEQKQIGELFKGIENTITLHQRKLDKLNSVKQAYLSEMFPAEGERVPKRRFPGFTDDWELRKLGEYSTLITKGTTPRDKSGIGVVNFVKVENLVNGDIIPLQKIQLEEHEGYLKRSQLIENDILFSIAGTLGRTAIVKKSILPANTNQALSIIRGYEFDRNFLVTILRGVVVREFIKRNPTIGAQPNLSLEQVSNLCLLTPCSEEQSAIGTFFSTLDRHITLHQRKS